MRILHYSDPHIPTPLLHVPLVKWLSKRAIGGANLLLGRYRLFCDGVRKLEALARFTEEQQVDLIICTGDYTALGLNHKYEEAVRVTRPLMEAPAGYIHVPGNHDYYISDALREKRFRTYFGNTMQSDMPEYHVDGPWPTVRIPIIVMDSHKAQFWKQIFDNITVHQDIAVRADGEIAWAFRKK